MAKPERYVTGKGFYDAVKDHANNISQRTGRSAANVRTEFFLKEVLALLAAADDGWVLKGGMSLRCRLPETRTTEDVDLHLTHRTLEATIDRFREAVHRKKRGEHLSFRVDDRVERKGSRSARMKVHVEVRGVRVQERVVVDLAAPVQITGRTEQIQLASPIQVAGHPELPAFALYPLADQIADKLCAMYEWHGRGGRTATTRYHDLWDLGAIVLNFPLEAAALAGAIATETSTRGLDLPHPLRLPEPDSCGHVRQYLRRLSATGRPTPRRPPDTEDRRPLCGARRSGRSGRNLGTEHRGLGVGLAGRRSEHREDGCDTGGPARLTLSLF
ncbi:nucleotidyl transferase AbiEii/AbiGii toxin family protein [Mariniluteicoccus flavus]